VTLLWWRRAGISQVETGSDAALMEESWNKSGGNGK